MENQTQTDEKNYTDLVEAMKEFKALFEKHNLGGFVSLVSPHQNYFQLFFAEWIGMKIVAPTFRGPQIEIKMDPNDPERNKRTIHWIVNIHEHCAQMAVSLFQLRKQFGLAQPQIILPK